MMELLRQLFDVAGGGPETDAFKHIRAAFTVLRSLGTAATVSNAHSSRMVSVVLSGTYLQISLKERKVKFHTLKFSVFLKRFPFSVPFSIM